MLPFSALLYTRMERGEIGWWSKPLKSLGNFSFHATSCLQVTNCCHRRIREQLKEHLSYHQRTILTSHALLRYLSIINLLFHCPCTDKTVNMNGLQLSIAINPIKINKYKFWVNSVITTRPLQFVSLQTQGFVAQYAEAPEWSLEGSGCSQVKACFLLTCLPANQNTRLYQKEPMRESLRL